MKTFWKIVLFCLLICCLLAGCGKKADESKPLGEVKAEAEKMDAEQLRSMATKYMDAVKSKEAEIEKVAAKLKDIPVTEMLGSEAKSLKAEIDNLNKSVSALKQRFDIYYNKLKETGGDLSGLGI